MTDIVLKVRESAQDQWVTNFSRQGGWKVRNQTNTGWITLHPANTRVRNATDTGWLTPK